MNGKLYLIGCGPGDADLLTLKALKTIEKYLPSSIIFSP
jgi:precorrin-2 methylase